MNFDKLFEAIEKHVVTPEAQKKLQQQLKDWEKHFEEEAKRREITEEFLNRRYTI